VIVLENISKTYWTPGGEKTVLNGINYAFGAGRSTGILGATGSGKSILMRLIAGIDTPTTGKIRRSVRVSWPLAYVGGFHTHLSVAENIRFAARIYGEDPGQISRFVESFAGLGDKMSARFAGLSHAERARLSIALSLAIQFDVYLVDELFIRGDQQVKQRYGRVVEQRLRESNVIVASQKPETILRFCQEAAVLHRGNLLRFPRLKSAFEAYHELTSAEPRG
jgi:capsular polysaccharide transport system ATP-binding protein